MRSPRFLQQNEIISLLAVFFAIAAGAQQLRLRELESQLQQFEEAVRQSERLKYELCASLERERAAVSEIARLKAELDKRKTPIITLSEDREEFRFTIGKAEVPSPFEQALIKEIIPRLERLSERYSCDAIQVTGHTDAAQHDSKTTSNLDALLVPTLVAGSSLTSLKHASNMDLGVVRISKQDQSVRSKQDRWWSGRVKEQNGLGEPGWRSSENGMGTVGMKAADDF
jgi:hypothetical protein